MVSVNWGPWDGGMVTAALKREFEKNSITLIPLAAGAVAGGAGYVGGRMHEKSKDKTEDMAIARRFHELGYRAAAQAITRRMSGGSNES